MAGRWISRIGVLLFALLSTSARANPCALASVGIGGTGAPAPIASEDSDEGGIGGTGLQADEGGIGGTGQRAESGIGGTGIVGVITGFGSICVGGVHIRYGTSTPIVHNGQPIAAGDLRVGHVVRVRARGLGSSVHANAIELTHVVSGPVDRIDLAAGRIDVLGQSVRAMPRLLEQAQAAARQRQPVQVSGLRDSTGVVVATRVDAAPGLREFNVQGQVRDAAGRRARVGNLAVALSTDQARNIRPDQPVEIRGTLDNGVLSARTVDKSGSAVLKDRVQRMVIEGYVGERQNGRVRVGDTFVAVGAALESNAGGLDRDQRVVVSARVEGEHLVAERVERVRDRDHGGGKSGGSGKNEDGVKDANREQKDRDEADKNEKDRDDKERDERKSDERSSDNKAREDGRDSPHSRGSGHGDRKDRDEHARGGGRDTDRPPREVRPDKPERGSSHGGRDDRVRDR